MNVNVLTCTYLVVLAGARPVEAAAGQWQVGARLGVAWLDSSGPGPSAEAYLRRGLSESFDLELQLMTSLHPFQPDSKSVQPAMAQTPDPAWALALTPGLVYRWDVLRAIPFAGLGLGIYEWRGVDAELRRAQFGASGRIGLDYLLSRDVVLSVQTSAHVALAENGVRLPWFQLGVGAAHAWGW